MTHIVTCKTRIGDEHYSHLRNLASLSLDAVSKMLKNRSEISTKHYQEIPSVIAKGLSHKYQRNPRCNSVRRLSLPVFGEKGVQVKIVPGGIRIPAIFKKSVIPIRFRLPVVGFIRQAEIYSRCGEWFIACSYNAKCCDRIPTSGAVGVDRNSSGNIATVADPKTGSVRIIGFNADRWKSNFRSRKAAIISHGRKRLASRLRRKQSRRTSYENHRASKSIVAFAARHRSAIVLEELNLRNGAKRYAEKSQWSHAQLEQFIQYKAALRGIPVIFVSPEFTSQDCSRCGRRNKPNGKSYSCRNCGSNTHRDVNAAFVIANRGLTCIGADGVEPNVSSSRSSGGPLSGKSEAVGASDQTESRNLARASSRRRLKND